MENIDNLVQLITDRLLENLRAKSFRKSVYVIGSSEIVSWLQENGFEISQCPDLADYIIVDSLPRDAFLRIASLCPITDTESIILSALLDNRKVLASIACFKLEEYRQTAKSMLYREMLQQKSKLEAYGVILYKNSDLLGILSSKDEVGYNLEQDFSPSKKEALSKKSKLLTESRLRAMGLGEGDVLKLDKGTIVTALARDYINRYKIRIE